MATAPTKRPAGLKGKAKGAGQSSLDYSRAHERDSGAAGDEARSYLKVLAKVRPGSRKAAKSDNDADD